MHLSFQCYSVLPLLSVFVKKKKPGDSVAAGLNSAGHHSNGTLYISNQFFLLSQCCRKG